MDRRRSSAASTRVRNAPQGAHTDAPGHHGQPDHGDATMPDCNPPPTRGSQLQKRS